jgi:hypothetical protein
MVRTSRLLMSLAQWGKWSEKISVKTACDSQIKSLTCDLRIETSSLWCYLAAEHKNIIFFRHPIFLTCRTEHEPVCIFQPRVSSYFFLQSTVFVSYFIFRFLPGMASLWYFRNILNFQIQLLTFGTFLFKLLAFG